MRERPVRFVEQRHDVGAELAQRLHGHETSHAVAAVHDHFEPPSQRRIALDDGLPVRGEESAVRGLCATGLRDELVVVDQPVEDLDVVAEDRVVRQHHLEAIEFRRVV